MSSKRAGQSVTIVLNFLQAVVMTWGALSTSGAVHVALWAMVGLYVFSVLCTLIFFVEVKR